MKKIAAFFLLMVFSGQTFSQAIVIFNFYIHQSYIAATQCENRYKPMLHCNGKCQLAKRLKQQEKKDQQNPERKLEDKNEIISSRTFFTIDFKIPRHYSFLYTNLLESKPTDRTFPIFHPPSA